VPINFPGDVTSGDRSGGKRVFVDPAAWLSSNVKELRVTRVETLKDGEDVVTFPRPIPLSMFVIAVASLLQWIVPIDVISDIAFIEDIDPSWLCAAGLIVALAGLSLSFASHWALKRRGADVHPYQPAIVLVTDGVFKWTRNPGYLGMLIGLSGIALAFGLDWLLILILPLWLVLNSVVVRQEELHLEHKFGNAYRKYVKRVPRYFFIH
jgi:protein-S-isoprenylcysteine O-methyltransferase Ste14